MKQIMVSECGRCGKEEQVNGPLVVTDSTVAIYAAVADLNLPDLVVIYNDSISTLDEICTKCEPTLARQIDVLMKQVKRGRRASKPDVEPLPTPTGPDTEPVVPAEKPAKSKKGNATKSK